MYRKLYLSMVSGHVRPFGLKWAEFWAVGMLSMLAYTNLASLDLLLLMGGFEGRAYSEGGFLASKVLSSLVSGIVLLTHIWLGKRWAPAISGFESRRPSALPGALYGFASIGLVLYLSSEYN